MASDWFTRTFGNAVSDVRRELIEKAWFGQAEPRQMGDPDRVLHDKLYPDKAAERGFLGWLEADHARDGDRKPEPPAPDHGIDR